MSRLENEYFGPHLGEVSLYQLPILSFHHACLSSNTKNSDPSAHSIDSTGKRLYAGAHAAIRFLNHYQQFFINKTVCELGCGIGGLGLMLTKIAPIRRMLLTDGNPDTLHITAMNINHFYRNGWNRYVSHLKQDGQWHATEDCESTDCLLEESSKLIVNPIIQSLVDCCPLYWGNREESHKIQANYNSNESFDIVIGCELMYYLTDISDLLETVVSLVDFNKGLFFHVHLFRKEGQEQELIELLERKYQWTTYEVSPRIFIDRQELSDHIEWFRMRSLISGPKLLLDRMYKEAPYNKEWKIFQPLNFEDEDPNQEYPAQTSNDIDMVDNSVFNLFS